MAYNTSEERLLNKIVKRAEVGKCGGQYIASGSNTTGDFAAIYCVADATLDFTSGTKTEGNLVSAADIALKAGVTVFGDFSQVVVAAGSGGVIAYNNC